MALTPMHLRLETESGRDGEEYRIYDGEIEVRRMQPSPDGNNEHDDSWHRVTSQELTDHVNHDTVVAAWLKQRMGWRRLLQACLPEQDRHLFEVPQSYSGHRAA